MNKLPKFQPILPLVYDDSLSYYEQLGKITYTLNQMIDTLTYDGLAYKGELETFLNFEPVPGYYSINVSESEFVNDDFPEEFSGPGTLLVLEGTDGTFQATILGDDTNIYTAIYSDGAWGEWSQPSENKLIYRGQINQFNGETVPTGKTGYWSVRNEGETEDLPGSEAGTWTFGTLIVVQNGNYYFAYLTCSNGHTYTRFRNPFTMSVWSDWRSDYGASTDLTDNVESNITIGNRGYLRYRLMGEQVFIDAIINSVPAPPDDATVTIFEGSTAHGHIPHNQHVAIQIPFIAEAGVVIGTCLVSTNGSLRVERAYNLDTGSKISSADSVHYMHIHATYSIHEGEEISG